MEKMTTPTNTPQPQQKPVLERLSILERATNDLYQTLDATFSQSREHLSVVMATLEGIMGALSNEDADFTNKVDAVVKAKKQERLQKKADREKQELEYLVKNNEIKVVDVISENSVLVGRMFDTEGNVVNVGYEQAPFAQFTEEAKKALLGQGIGFVFEAANKTKFEVLAVYDPVPKTATPSPTPAQPEATGVAVVSPPSDTTSTPTVTV